MDNINNINVPEEEQENLKVIGTSLFADNYYNKIQETLINMPTIYDKMQKYNIENSITKAIDLQNAWQEKLANMPTIYDKMQSYKSENPITKVIELQNAWQDKIINNSLIEKMTQQENTLNLIEPLEENNKILDANKRKDSKKDDKNDEE